jgi:hypothetical protein
MRGLKRLLALAALLSFVIVAQASKAQEAVSYYGFNFPQKIGPLTQGGVTNFEKDNPGLGYGIRYSGEGLRVDIFVYNLRKSSISWDVFHADQKQEFNNAIRDVYRAKERGLYREVKEGDEFESPAVKNPFFWCKAFVLDRGEGRIEDSALCLGARNNTFFKIRIGMTPPGPDFPRRADMLLREISRAVKF